MIDSSGFVLDTTASLPCQYFLYTEDIKTLSLQQSLTFHLNKVLFYNLVQFHVTVPFCICLLPLLFSSVCSMYIQVVTYVTTT